MATLEILTGKNAGKRHQLTGSETLVGRNLNCDIVLAEGQVSRKHVRILNQADGFWIEDLNSQNGTFLNGTRLESRTRLQTSDQIQIKDILLTFHEDFAAASVLEDQDDSQYGALLPGDKPESSSTILKVLDAAQPQTKANAQQKLKAVLEISHNLGNMLDVAQVLPKILESIFRFFPQADRGYIMLADGPQGQLVPRVFKQREVDEDDSISIRPISRTIAQQVMTEGRAILSSDAAQDERFKASESVVNLSIRSMMCAPLMGPSGRPQGIIQIDSPDLARQFDADDLDVLVNMATLAGQAIENAALHETRIELDRHERELETARHVQMQLLPQTQPKLPEYSFFEYYKAAEEVGGDYFGYIELPDGRLAIALGDVAGHGVAAALLMAQLCSEVRYCLVTTDSPAQAVRNLNQQMCQPALSGRFVTFVLCVLDPQKHEITLVNAGHLQPLLRDVETAAVEPLGVVVSGTPLGFEPDRLYDQILVKLKPGDVVLLYTDGINEAIDANKELYGSHRVRDVVAATSGDAAKVGKTLLTDVQRFMRGTQQRDDICLLCFGRIR